MGFDLFGGLEALEFHGACHVARLHTHVRCCFLGGGGTEDASPGERTPPPTKAS